MGSNSVGQDFHSETEKNITSLRKSAVYKLKEKERKETKRERCLSLR